MGRSLSILDWIWTTFLEGGTFVPGTSMIDNTRSSISLKINRNACCYYVKLGRKRPCGRTEISQELMLEVVAWLVLIVSLYINLFVLIVTTVYSSFSNNCFDLNSNTCM